MLGKHWFAGQILFVYFFFRLGIQLTLRSSDVSLALSCLLVFNANLNYERDQCLTQCYGDIWPSLHSQFAFKMLVRVLNSYIELHADATQLILLVLAFLCF